MKKKLSNGVVSACCFIFSMAVFADLNGKWAGSITTPDGQQLPVTYTFKVDGNKLTGTAESPAGVISVDDGHVVADSFNFKVTVDGNDYPHAGKIYDDSLVVDIDFGVQKVKTTLKRVVDK